MRRGGRQPLHNGALQTLTVDCSVCVLLQSLEVQRFAPDTVAHALSCSAAIRHAVVAHGLFGDGVQVGSLTPGNRPAPSTSTAAPATSPTADPSTHSELLSSKSPLTVRDLEESVAALVATHPPFLTATPQSDDGTLARLDIVGRYSHGLAGDGRLSGGVHTASERLSSTGGVQGVLHRHGDSSSKGVAVPPASSGRRHGGGGDGATGAGAGPSGDVPAALARLDVSTEDGRGDDVNDSTGQGKALGDTWRRRALCCRASC